MSLRVSDTGCGIAAADLPRIFDESFSTRQGGGLGLPIARRIVEQHGGAIRVESTEGSGTTFTVWLPAAYGAPSLLPVVGLALLEQLVPRDLQAERQHLFCAWYRPLLTTGVGPRVVIVEPLATPLIDWMSPLVTLRSGS